MLFLLPFVSPFILLNNWLPIIYLAAWPIIINLLGLDMLLTNAILSLLFITTCDFTRRMMVDLVSVKTLNI